MDIREKIRDISEDVLELESGTLGYDDPYSDYEIDSFMAGQLACMLEDEFDIQLEDDMIKDIVSVNAAAEMVERLQK